MDHCYDAIIIGAGVAGSSAAKALADKGWKVLCIDRRSFPRHKVCGEFLSPESRTTLQALGLRETVESLAPSSIKRARIAFGEQDGFVTPLPGTAYGVSRFRLDQALHEAAERSGAIMLTGAMATKVERIGHAYAVETRQGNERFVYYARTAIAAWGMNRPPNISDDDSRQAQRCRQSSYIGVKSHYTGYDIGRTIELYFVPGGYVGVAPVGGGAVNVAALLDRKTVPGGRASDVLSMIENAAGYHAGLQHKLSRAEPLPGTQAAAAPVILNRRPAFWERLPQIGDAGSMLPPLCGDGMAVALHSARLCAAYADSYLRGELALADWRRLYDKAMRKAIGGPLFWGRLLHRTASLPMLPRLFHAMGGRAPQLAYRFVRATRLREQE